MDAVIFGCWVLGSPWCRVQYADGSWIWGGLVGVDGVESDFGVPTGTIVVSDQPRRRLELVCEAGTCTYLKNILIQTYLNRKMIISC
jgi:hypothetical protein